MTHEQGEGGPPSNTALRDSADEAAELQPRIFPDIQQTFRNLAAPLVNHQAVMRLLQESGKDAPSVINALGSCPVLSARLVSVINSAAFGAPWRASSITDAVNTLGPKRARAIALAYALRSVTRPAGLQPATLQALWAGSVQKACAARLFCQEVDPKHADMAYTLGLIQDLGLPMLMGVDPQFYLDPPPPTDTAENWVEAEHERFGGTHGVVGQELLMSWQAGDKLQQLVVSHHNAPPDGSAPADPLHLAHFLASLLPHFGEPLDPQGLLWLEHLHERHLQTKYPLLDSFLNAVEDEAQRVLGPGDGAQKIDRAALIAGLTRAVTGDAIHHTARLCKLEQALRGQRESFTALREQAFTDSLTRLLNRRGFLELADRRIQSDQLCGRGVCCMAFDLDGLKTLNDAQGHDAGDMLLRGFAKLLRRFLDEDDLIARFGGDEYAVLIGDVDEATARKVSDRIAGQLHSSRLRLRPGLEMQVSCSIGAVFHDRSNGPVEIEDILARADHVMYQRKHSGKRGLTFEVYAPALPGPGDTQVSPKIE